MMLRGNVAIASKGAAPVLLAPSVCAASACCSPRPLADRAHDFVPTQQFGQLVGTWGQREQQRQARTHRRSSMQARQVMGGRGGAAGPLGHQTPQQQQQLRQQMQMQMLRQQQEEEEVQDPKTMGGKLRWWEDLEDEQDRRDEEDFTLLTRDEIDERVEDAAGMISMLDDLRPVDRSFNAFAEVWTRIARIPPEARIRLLQEVEPGGIRSLWRASMSRYVLDDARALELLQSYSLGQDFPQQPGQVVSYAGRCERFEYAQGEVKFSVDQAMQDKYPRSKPWLRPTRGSLRLPQERFTQHFFLHPRSRVMHARVALPLAGPLERWWVPSYCRVKPELVLTPLEEDAGADITLEYPNLGGEEGSEGALLLAQQQAAQAQARAQLEQQAASKETGGGAASAAAGALELAEAAAFGEGLGAGSWWDLTKEDLPVSGWPEPQLDMWSPFSQSSRDYVRVAGPGVYVGCAYHIDARGRATKDDCMYFMLVRKF